MSIDGERLGRAIAHHQMAAAHHTCLADCGFQIARAYDEAPPRLLPRTDTLVELIHATAADAINEVLAVASRSAVVDPIGRIVPPGMGSGQAGRATTADRDAGGTGKRTAS